ncbi:integral peroxisomal membrane peroxin [Tothia fuscella]|uniref:Integral peroxisomal membrane peroxin n=1 Tax=Tothia fuscella TaxID=1048955 RepID=A0A9P4NJP7_9PEZI|nr:integral peroxisomal membrane peroxin [Tothia fuscella]
MIPSDVPGENVEVDKRSRKYVDRPGFSLQAMSNNFRRFNARIGPVFVFQNRAIRLFTWRTPTHTLAFLATYTFVVLDPALLTILPLAVILFFIMVPAFLTRHPPPPTLLPSELYPLGGPPLAPPPKIKPAPELSKDFFRNMRDLQNCMDDYSVVHDKILSQVAPLTNFEDEAISSTLFTTLFLSSLVLFVSAQLLPWRFIALVAGWVGVSINHPFIQDLLATPDNQRRLEDEEKVALSRAHTFAQGDVILDPAPEKREVEIFELQHREPYAMNYDKNDREWEAWVFTPSPFDPLSPGRIAGDRPRGTRFFEDVAAPRGWKWADKKWTLDLLSREWVEERCIAGVEVEVEGERWVSDILYEKSEDLDEALRSPTKKGKEQKQNGAAAVTWEEGQGRHKLGEWRRRRWVRTVERVPNPIVGKGDGMVVVNNDE